MTCEQRPFDVRQHGLVEADDAGKPVLAGAHSGEQVLSDLLFDGPVDVAARTELTDCGGPGRSAGGGMLAVLLHIFDTMSATGVFASSAGQRGG